MKQNGGEVNITIYPANALTPHTRTRTHTRAHVRAYMKPHDRET